MFQDPQVTPETAGSIEPYIVGVFPTLSLIYNEAQEEMHNRTVTTTDLYRAFVMNTKWTLVILGQPLSGSPARAPRARRTNDRPTQVTPDTGAMERDHLDALSGCRWGHGTGSPA